MLPDAHGLSQKTLCHICGKGEVNLFPNYPSLPRVASDCTPWRSGGRLGTCESCLCVQNPVDDLWQNETNEVYGRYKIYTQSAGSEQGMFTNGEKLVPRSAKIFQQAISYLDLKKSGRLLDIGCANGQLLRYFSTIAPHWKLVGFEIDDKRRKEVESIPGVEAFASGSLDKISGKFDIITLIHVLEHLAKPIQWLKDLRRILQPDGFVLIQVPDPMVNPYNLLVADHCSHFIMPDLITIAQQAGYDVITHSDKWVAREFSILIKPISNAKEQVSNTNANSGRTASYPAQSIQWLHDIEKQAKALPKDKKRGIWGTAIAATWLYSLMDEQVDFFVDEDSHRIGQEHLGKPVYHPDSIPTDSHIFVALTPEIATNIVNRWSHLPATLHVPPSLVY